MLHIGLSHIPPSLWPHRPYWLSIARLLPPTTEKFFETTHLNCLIIREKAIETLKQADHGYKNREQYWISDEFKKKGFVIGKFKKLESKHN